MTVIERKLFIRLGQRVLLSFILLLFYAANLSATESGFVFDGSGYVMVVSVNSDPNIDQCPNTPAGEVEDSSGCSASQRDVDFDGVSDLDDLCPNTDIASAGYVDTSGCSTEQIAELYGPSGPTIISCVDRATGAVREATSCNVDEDADSDQDGVIDSDDSYPLQSSTQCYP